MARIGDWMQTFTGGQFWPLDPRPEEVDIRDIAHALANICRFNGHARRFYSVAEHCCHISDALPFDLRLHGLLHDAAEAYFGDVVRPIKRSLPQIKPAEDVIETVIRRRFYIEDGDWEAVKECDRRMLTAEMEQAMATTPPAAWSDMLPALPVQIGFWTPNRARVEFMDRFLTLWDAL